MNKLSPTEFVSLGSLIGVILTQFINPNEQNTLLNFLELIGQILLTSYAQATVTDPHYINLSKTQGEELQKQYKFLFKKSTEEETDVVFAELVIDIVIVDSDK